MFMYGFSCLRFLSRFLKTGLSIAPFGGTLQLHTYTFKQVANLRPIVNPPASGRCKLLETREGHVPLTALCIRFVSDGGTAARPGRHPASSRSRRPRQHAR